MVNSPEDIKKLNEICEHLNKVSVKKYGVSLKVTEIKGTIFYIPELPANSTKQTAFGQMGE